MGRRKVYIFPGQDYDQVKERIFLGVMKHSQIMTEAVPSVFAGKNDKQKQSLMKRKSKR